VCTHSTRDSGCHTCAPRQRYCNWTSRSTCPKFQTACADRRCLHGSSPRAVPDGRGVCNEEHHWDERAEHHHERSAESTDKEHSERAPQSYTQGGGWRRHPLLCVTSCDTFTEGLGWCVDTGTSSSPCNLSEEEQRVWAAGPVCTSAALCLSDTRRDTKRTHAVHPCSRRVHLLCTSSHTRAHGAQGHSGTHPRQPFVNDS
jgi:hypothetical protein